MKTDMTFTPRMQCRCRCGKMVAIGHSNDVPMAIHELPTCKPFMDLSLEMFVAYLRS